VAAGPGHRPVHHRLTGAASNGLTHRRRMRQALRPEHLTDLDLGLGVVLARVDPQPPSGPPRIGGFVGHAAGQRTHAVAARRSASASASRCARTL
jgi:hypothetical protein